MFSEHKTCQNCKQNFVIEPDDFTFYAKIKVPSPSWCPRCRFQRRALFRNERKLFRNTDGLTGKSILALYQPESGYTIYPDKEWWSQEKWDPLAYGQNFDPSRSFLVQFFELLQRVPKRATEAVNMVNSEYSANAADLKNCYLCFNSNFSEDCAYGNGVDLSRNCFDNSHIQKSERCYGSFWLTNCYETHFSSQCEDCASVWFSKNCRGCTDCLGCVNLRTKKYCLFNVQYSKEEYEARISDLKLHTWNGLTSVHARAKEFWLRFPNKSLQGIQNLNVSGEYITHSKNIRQSYLIQESENLAYIQYSQVPSSRDCADSTIIGSRAELIYESAVCGWGASRLKFCWECWDGGREFEYCMMCARSAANLFGCVGITKNQYCILNKPYSEEEYFELREKIVQHMNEHPYVDKRGRVYRYGEFFPPEFSPFAYNQTIAPEHFPLTKEGAIAYGARWQDPLPTEYQTTMSASDIPDDIKDVPEYIVKEILECRECRRAYRLIQPELQFLKQLKIPAPRSCIDCRHYGRIAERNRSQIYARKCQCGGGNSDGDVYKNSAVHFHGPGHCPNEFETSYAPDRPEIVYCEQCYNAEVV